MTLRIDTLSQHARRHGQDQGHTSTVKRHCKTIFISDIHLGTKDCKAKLLNTFLKHYSCENLYLVGDIVDGWKMKKNVYWHRDFNRVIRRILKLSKQGVNITYVTGNHDEFLRKYANHQFDNIRLCNRACYQSVSGKRILVIHGDQFEGVARCGKFLKIVGDVGYGFLMAINRRFNRMRSYLGYGYWSCAQFLKEHLQRAQVYIADYENAVAYGAKKQGFDGVICGHIHHATTKTLLGIEYYNTGDWVESCSAIIEHHDGQFELIFWSDPELATGHPPRINQQPNAATY